MKCYGVNGVRHLTRKRKDTNTERREQILYLPTIEEKLNEWGYMI